MCTAAPRPKTRPPTSSGPTGYYDYQGITQIRRSFRGYGDVVLVDGDVRIQVVVKSGARDFVSRYLQAWTRRDGRWQMVSWQSTPIPA